MGGKKTLQAATAGIVAVGAWTAPPTAIKKDPRKMAIEAAWVLVKKAAPKTLPLTSAKPLRTDQYKTMARLVWVKSSAQFTVEESQ